MSTGSLCHLLHPHDWRMKHKCSRGIKCGDCQLYETGLGYSDLIPMANYPVPATETVNALAMPYVRVMPLVKWALLNKVTRNVDYWLSAGRQP